MTQRHKSQRTNTGLVESLPPYFNGVVPEDGGQKSSTGTNIINGKARSLPKQVKTCTNLVK